MKRILRIATTCACCLAGPIAFAQDGPAIDTSGGNVAPAQNTNQPSNGGSGEAAGAETGNQQPAVDTGSAGPGTSVIGDTESPIGLYIIPWRSTSPTPQLDRPARFVDATEEPVDETQFRRFVEYHEALTRHRAAQQRAAEGSAQ